MKRTLFFVFMSVTGFYLQAQNLDSLWNLWQDETQPDTTRLKAIQKLAWDGYLFSQPDSAFYYAQLQYDFAKSNGHKKQMATSLKIQGVANVLRGNNIKALEYFQKSLAIQKELGDKEGSANTLNNIGNIYLTQGNNSTAREYYQKSLSIRGELGNKKKIAVSLANISNTYNNQDNYIQALEYCQKSLTIREEMGDEKAIAASLNAIGSIYKNLENYSKALDYCQKSLVISEELGDKNYIHVNTLNNIGYIYYHQGNYPKALKYCKNGLELAEKVGFIRRQKEACECLYGTYKAMGQGNEALVYLEKMNVLTDSLNVEETNKKLQQMEFAKQMLADSIAKAEEARLIEEAHQEEVRKKNQSRNWSIVGGIFALLLAGGFYSRWRYVRKSRDIISKEKDRSENLLLNILPAEIAEELKEKGKADARYFEMVSILFSDFAEFTEQSAKMSATDLVNEVNHCFGAFDAIMEKYGIEKIKTIGDAYMAAGGLPVPSEDSVKNTVLAAIEMQDFAIARYKSQVASGEPAFQMRVGIHTGPVVAGIVGVKKFQYDVWGDTVNTASRMESSGQVGKVNISQATYEVTKGDPYFDFQSRGKIEAKGKGEIEMYFVSKA